MANTVFQRMRISLEGFDTATYDNLASKIVKNGGVLAPADEVRVPFSSFFDFPLQLLSLFLSCAGRGSSVA